MTVALPLYPIAAGAPYRGEWFPLHFDRLLGSRFLAVADFEHAGAALVLWAASCRQDPVGTLPDDDVELARLAGLGRDVEAWRRLRGGALYGFERVLVADEDGVPLPGHRLGHKVLAHCLVDAMARMDRRRASNRRAGERSRRSELRRHMRRLEIPDHFVNDDAVIDAMVAELTRRNATWYPANVQAAFDAVKTQFEETRRSVTQIAKRFK